MLKLPVHCVDLRRNSLIVKLKSAVLIWKGDPLRKYIEIIAEFCGRLGVNIVFDHVLHILCRVPLPSSLSYIQSTADYCE